MIKLALGFTGLLMVTTASFSIAGNDGPLQGKTLCFVTAKQHLDGKWTNENEIGKYEIDTTNTKESIALVMSNDWVLKKVQNFKGYTIFYECMSETGMSAKKIEN